MGSGADISDRAEKITPKVSQDYEAAHAFETGYMATRKIDRAITKLGALAEDPFADAPSGAEDTPVVSDTAADQDVFATDTPVETGRSTPTPSAAVFDAQSTGEDPFQQQIEDAIDELDDPSDISLPGPQTAGGQAEAQVGSQPIGNAVLFGADQTDWSEDEVDEPDGQEIDASALPEGRSSSIGEQAFAATVVDDGDQDEADWFDPETVIDDDQPPPAEADEGEEVGPGRPDVDDALWKEEDLAAEGAAGTALWAEMSDAATEDLPAEDRSVPFDMEDGWSIPDEDTGPESRSAADDLWSEPEQSSNEDYAPDEDDPGDPGDDDFDDDSDWDWQDTPDETGIADDTDVAGEQQSTSGTNDGSGTRRALVQGALLAVAAGLVAGYFVVGGWSGITDLVRSDTPGSETLAGVGATEAAGPNTERQLSSPQRDAAEADAPGQPGEAGPGSANSGTTPWSRSPASPSADVPAPEVAPASGTVEVSDAEPAREPAASAGPVSTKPPSGMLALPTPEFLDAAAPAPAPTPAAQPQPESAAEPSDKDIPSFSSALDTPSSFGSFEPIEDVAQTEGLPPAPPQEDRATLAQAERRIAELEAQMKALTERVQQAEMRAAHANTRADGVAAILPEFAAMQAATEVLGAELVALMGDVQVLSSTDPVEAFEAIASDWMGGVDDQITNIRSDIALLGRIAANYASGGIPALRHPDTGMPVGGTAAASVTGQRSVRDLLASTPMPTQRPEPRMGRTSRPARVTHEPAGSSKKPFRIETDGGGKLKNVQVGDFVEGMGEVLDIRSATGGGRLVITENVSVFVP